MLNNRKNKSLFEGKKVFNFNQKSIMLTYARTDKSGIQKADLGNYLITNFNPSVVVVCLEHHKDGNPHLHAWLEWENKFNSRDPRIFDFKGHHPHIGGMKNKQKNTRGNALTYMMKEDTDLFVYGMDLEKWKYSCANKKKYMAEDLISGKTTINKLMETNPELLYNYRNLKNNLMEYNLDKNEIRFIDRIKNNLWIYGSPGIGKSYYVFTKYKDAYTKAANKWWDGYNNQDTVILDDFDSKSREIAHYIKLWSDNYIYKGEIKNGNVKLTYIRFIITSNYIPKTLYGEDLNLINSLNRRFNFYTVQGIFPNFELVPLDIQDL